MAPGEARQRARVRGRGARREVRRGEGRGPGREARRLGWDGKWKEWEERGEKKL